MLTANIFALMGLRQLYFLIGGIILGLLINIIYFANITSFYQEFMKGIIIIVALLFGAVPRLRRELSHH